VLGEMAHEFHGWFAMALHGFMAPPFWIALAGFLVATYVYFLKPGTSTKIRGMLGPIPAILEKKYGFDELYQALFARGSLLLGRGLWRGGDVAVIDNGMVNGGAALVERVSSVLRLTQSGHLYDYAFAIILGLIALVGAFLIV
jgi:NADH-quinone oxidoreductase subunit L